MVRSRSLGDGTICVESAKMIRAGIQANDEQSEQLEDLYAAWSDMLKYCVRNYLSQLRRSTGSALYASLRRRFPRLQSYHVCAVIKVAEGKVRAVRTTIKNWNCEARVQKKWGGDPVQLYYGHSHTYRIAKKDNDFHMKISYVLRNLIEVKLLLTGRDKSLIEEALNGKYELAGALLSKKENEWLLYIAIKKVVLLPRWEDCETIVGVDVGMKNMAYAVAYDTVNRRFHGESFSAKGNRYNHILRTYRRKLAEIESRCGKVSKRYREVNAKYNRVRNEIFHTISRRIVLYAQRFRRPIIAMEDLSKLKNNRRARSQRYKLSMWAKKKIQQYITYKTMWEGIPCILVDPHHTSVTCNKCGKKDERNGWQFKCRRYEYAAYVDENASKNIALKARKIIDSRSVDTQAPVGLPNNSPRDDRRGFPSSGRACTMKLKAGEGLPSCPLPSYA